MNKPIVVAEFAMEPNQNNPPGIAKSALYDTLYQLGYAGALAWSWTNPTISSPADMLTDIQSVWTNHNADVAINKIVSDWPSITITNPVTRASYPDSSTLTFYVTVSDTLPISSVAFYADTTIIGTVTTPYAVSSDTSLFLFRWNNISPGSYMIKAIASNSVGHSTASNLVSISIGKPPMMRLEAESAARPRSGIYREKRPNSKQRRIC